MVSLQGFNAANVDPQGDRSPLPAGKYVCIIKKTEQKSTKAGDGKYLEFQFQVVQDGQHKGRMLFARLNLWNKSEQAKSIAQSELSSICRAVGIMEPNDSSMLHDKPLVVSVALEKRKDTGEPTNVVKGYSKPGEPSQADFTEPVKPKTDDQVMQEMDNSAPWS